MYLHESKTLKHKPARSLSERNRKRAKKSLPRVSTNLLD